MSVTIKWDNEERTALRYTFTGCWQWQEFQETFGQAQQMLRSVRHAVDVIADFHESSCAPTEVLARLAYVGNCPPKNLRRSVIVGTKAFAMTSFAVFSAFYTQQARACQFAYTLDRARSLLGAAVEYYVMPVNKTA
jgi:hypothetical protein